MQIMLVQGTRMFQYFDKIVRTTPAEDALMVLQIMKGMIGKKFSFLNYYKEIPVSYDATLLAVENEMAEFDVHEYQAKVVNIEKKALIYCPEKTAFSDDIFGEAFYVNVPKKKIILCKFSYAKIRSDMRRFVRVVLDKPLGVDLAVEGEQINAVISDISLGGAALKVTDTGFIKPGLVVSPCLKLCDPGSGRVTEVELNATIVRIVGETAPFICLLEFHPDKNAQQQIAYFINQRQVEIIKELKDLGT